MSKTMKKVEVRCREGISELFKIEQLYGVLNEEYDIHVNGSIEMTEKDYGNLKKVKVYTQNRLQRLREVDFLYSLMRTGLISMKLWLAFSRKSSRLRA